jgi:hypothetical protein
MINYPTRPSSDFYQTPAVSSRAAEILTLSILRVLVDKKVLSGDEALAVFDNLGPLAKGINNAHEVGQTISLWRRTFAWLLGQDPAPPSSRAA